MRWDGADLAIEVHLGKKKCAEPDRGSKVLMHVETQSIAVAQTSTSNVPGIKIWDARRKRQ